MASSPSILFMGTPSFAATALVGLVEAGFNIMAVITQPDKKSGRGSSSKVEPCKVQGATLLEAKSYNIPIYQPFNKAELTEIVQKLQPELIVVAAYGMIIPQAVLDIPKFGALNIHGSLLPKYRGASPISEAILNGDSETGVTIMQMSAGMDEGPIIKQYKLPIFSPHSHPEQREGSQDSPPCCEAGSVTQNDNEEWDTTGSLTQKMADLGAKAIVETIPLWISGKLKAIPQHNDQATYCKKITKEDGHIDWDKPAIQIERMIRAYNPWPTAYAFIDEKRVKIISARHCEEPGDAAISNSGVLYFQSGHIYIGTNGGTLEILELQPEGKKPMLAKDFINGNIGLNTKKLT